MWLLRWWCRLKSTFARSWTSAWRVWARMKTPSSRSSAPGPSRRSQLSCRLMRDVWIPIFYIPIFQLGSPPMASAFSYNKHVNYVWMADKTTKQKASRICKSYDCTVVLLGTYLSVILNIPLEIRHAYCGRNNKKILLISWPIYIRCITVLF